MGVGALLVYLAGDDVSLAGMAVIARAQSQVAAFEFLTPAGIAFLGRCAAWVNRRASHALPEWRCPLAYAGDRVIVSVGAYVSRHDSTPCLIVDVRPLSMLDIPYASDDMESVSGGKAVLALFGRQMPYGDGGVVVILSGGVAEVEGPPMSRRCRSFDFAQDDRRRGRRTCPRKRGQWHLSVRCRRRRIGRNVRSTR